MKAFVTGAAGFIASNLVDRLLSCGNEVVGFDNLSTGQPEFLTWAYRHPEFTLVSGDVKNEDELRRAMVGCDVVYHLAANADVRFGTDHPEKDMQENTIGTVAVLEAMRINGVGRIVFSSTASVYGEAEQIPTPENCSFPVQTSLYAASKMAAEGFIQAYCEGFGMRATIFRFVSILGERYTHGHIFDFYRQLKEHPDRLRVLGDGSQRKSYLYVQDCVRALASTEQAQSVQIFNLGHDTYVNVNRSIAVICETMGVNPEIVYGGGDRGWVGDNPFIHLDTGKIKATGWRVSLSIEDAVRRTVEWLRENEWVFSVR